MLRARDYLLLVLGEWPKLRPTWKLRLMARGWSVPQYRRLRRDLTGRLGSLGIGYALVFHDEAGKPHDHGFLRGGSIEKIRQAVRESATRVGYDLRPADLSVTRFTTVEGHIKYVTRRDKAIRAAPKRWRVFTASPGYAPISFKDGRIVAFKRKLDPDEVDPKMLEGLADRVERRYERYYRRYGMKSPNDL